MFVDAIEGGKIVRVSEEYAKQESLFILKKVTEEKGPHSPIAPKWKLKEKEEKRPLFDDYRKPLRYTKDPLLSELVENFHWILLEKRRAKNLSRKQVSRAINASEIDIKILENGVLPNKDFVLVNKLEKYYGINLRKGSMNYQDSFRSKIGPQSSQAPQRNEPSKKESSGIAGNDIELIDID
jgi:ribosome-binding protein aMBF1 (putative translation factor)